MEAPLLRGYEAYSKRGPVRCVAHKPSLVIEKLTIARKELPKTGFQLREVVGTLMALTRSKSGTLEEKKAIISLAYIALGCYSRNKALFHARFPLFDERRLFSQVTSKPFSKYWPGAYRTFYPPWKCLFPRFGVCGAFLWFNGCLPIWLWLHSWIKESHSFECPSGIKFLPILDKEPF
jgi:hypothetical protein